MAVDAELISSEGFNLKFKNYLRDFFVYQFKEKGSDFKAKGKNDKNDVNKIIIDPTFNPDAKRLQYVLEQTAGVEWSKGDFVDLSKGRINKKRENKRVECITVDSRQVECNPFFYVYQFCSESSESRGAHFLFIYAVILYLQLGKTVILSNYKPLTKEQLKSLNEHLVGLAAIIESDVRRHKLKSWEDFSDEDKSKFAQDAIEKFKTDHDEINEIYDYIVLNRQKIIFNNGSFAVVPDQSKFVEKNVLFYAMKQLGFLNRSVDDNEESDQKKQFGNKMQELTRLGIIVCEKRGQRIYYALNDAYLSDFFGESNDLSCRFSDCINFFSQTSLLGEIGTYISNRLDHKNKLSMRFKHNYIKRGLNDYNNIDLLYAIKNKYFALIEYRNASLDDLEYQQILCYPLEIRESVTDGRQYLIYYHPHFRSVSAVRIEFIDGITIGELPKAEYFDDDIRRTKELINHTWGTAFDKFQEGNVKTQFESQRVRIIVSFDENEDFIKARLQREIRNCGSLAEIDTNDYGRCIEVIAEVANPWEMLQWLRSYITRIVSVEINGKEYNEFNGDVIRTYKSYIEPTLKPTKNISSRTGKSLIFDEIPSNFKKKENMHSLLFNEIFGISFTRLGEILLSTIRESKFQKSKLKEMKMDYADQFFFEGFKERVQLDTEDRRIEQVEGFIDAFVQVEGTDVVSKFKLIDPLSICKPQDFLPLTSIEIQWMINILNHPLAKCFLVEEEIEHILDWLGTSDLFDINTVVLYDQYIGVEEFYKGSNFSASMQTLMRAIKEKRMVCIRYKSQYDRQSNYICAPVYIEYSKRDNRIRVRAVSKSKVAKTFNLERILDVVILDEVYDKKATEDILEKHLRENECELVIFFNETRNIPDRILTEFSCFKKKCVKWGNERYRMTLFYDKEDKREILVRLLSYGSLIHVFDDTGDVRHELIERLEKQLELTNSMELVFAIEDKERD